MFQYKDIDYFDNDEENFDTILADDIIFEGSVKIEKPFMIKGTIKGELNATSDLVVDTDAVVHANVVGKRVLVRGKIIGNIDAYDLVFVTATGSVEGDITSSKVVLEPGCVFSGRCTMTKREDTTNDNVEN